MKQAIFFNEISAASEAAIFGILFAIASGFSINLHQDAVGWGLGVACVISVFSAMLMYLERK